MNPSADSSQIQAQLRQLEEELDHKSKQLRIKEYETQEIHVEDDGESNWLISYADMMTLLFGFFVVLSAFSTPDAGKMESLKKQTAKAMGGKYVLPYEKMTMELKKVLHEANLDKEVTITEAGDGVTIVSKGTLFFNSGSAQLNDPAAHLMNQIADILAVQAKGFRVTVEGHTDDTPIVSKLFPSNWELSSSRAGAVVRLLEQKGLLSKDLRPVGLAATEPLLPNRDPAGIPIAVNQAENRRIVIRVQRQLPPRLDPSKR